MSIWTDLGFRESPYATAPIPATAEGERLLVGRTRDIGRLERLLTSSTLHPTIEGDNGVGKTSLVSVAGFRLQSAFELGAAQEALIPLARPYQLTPTDTLTSFTARVLFDVANAFVEHGQLLKRHGLSVPDTRDVDRWLNAPVFTSRGGGAGAFGFSGEASYGSEPNTSAGFTDSGFVATVTRWLRDCFPSRQSGGFICVIDNLELLETSQAARTLLESLRDSVLSLPGLRWVLCGARGIIRTAASSQRLEGRLAEPLELLPVSDESVAEVIARRIDVFGVRPDAVAPVGPDGFQHIYDVLNKNLRNALKFCEDFSFWLSEQDHDSYSPRDNYRLLEVWLSDKADASNANTSLGNRAWGLFDGIAEAGGSISPSDYSRFDFNSLPAMRPHVKALEDANLVQSAVDETDKRRRTIVVTPRGWLVRYARGNYKRP